MVDFATNITIHSTKIGYQNSTFTWKVLSLKVICRPHLIDHIFGARITLILLFASLFY